MSKSKHFYINVIMLGLVITFKHHLRYLKICYKIFLVQKYIEFNHIEGYDVFTVYFSAPKIKFVCHNNFLWKSKHL